MEEKRERQDRRLTVWTRCLAGLVVAVAASVLCVRGSHADELLPIIEKGPAVGLQWEWVHRQIEIVGEKRRAYSRRYWAVASYGIASRIKLFVRGGLAETDAEGFQSKGSWAYGGGGAVELYRHDDFSLGVGGQITKFGFGKDKTATAPSLDASWLEYEAVGGLTYRGWPKVTPFVGVLISRIDGSLETGPFTLSGPFPIPIPVPAMTLDFKQKTAVGGVMGVRYQVMDRIELTATGKFLDRVSVGLEGAYRF